MKSIKIKIVKESFSSGGTLTKSIIKKALIKLGDKLKEKNIKIDLVVAGGIISVLYFNNRESTKDIDAIFPNNPDKLKILKELIDEVSEEQNLEKGVWLNDSISFFGLETKSKLKIFNHSNLVLYSAKWEELLGMKLSGAWRSDKDKDDALETLKRIKGKSKEEILKLAIKYKNAAPVIADKEISERFNYTWKKAYEEEK
ncbi:MAG: hypothetical protein H8E16_11960 [Flavobacteriales bacterium]|nr:hypothetical protein [Flavobacteriales bacterium]